MIKFFSSKHPTNEFAPSWHIPMYNELFSLSECDPLKKWLLDNQEEFLKYPTNTVGDTGLASNSITARLGSYNLFDYRDQCEHIDTLYNFIQTLYLDFVTRKGAAIRNCDIIGWFNVLEKGDKIKPHHHGATADTYISGNMHLDDYNTHTLYVSPYDNQQVLADPNKKGNVTLFPTYLEHCTTEHNDDTPRVSIAFDIVLYIENNKNPVVPLINAEILSKLTEDFE